MIGGEAAKVDAQNPRVSADEAFQFCEAAATISTCAFDFPLT